MPYGVQKRPKSREAIKALIKLVGTKQNTNYPEHLLAETFGVKASAVTNWACKGIPMQHWGKFAALAGVAEDALWAAHKVVQKRWEREGGKMLEVSSKRVTRG